MEPQSLLLPLLKPWNQQISQLQRLRWSGMLDLLGEGRPRILVVRAVSEVEHTRWCSRPQ